ncbi:hypothetical protein K2173_001875 [Erythroxylum novogranatense]|uniref:TSL-kinase interacting protein 1 n=1 Tax=Erythroxylum novogranatense TaxID=1862640 RepID=A0AAV8SNX0_9ROSI|nr:hypothetical protein K2173_001875 [Erythroxylum novogranatense]
MESLVSLDSEAHIILEETPRQGRDPDFTSLTAGDTQQKQPVKKPTRQWAAWTHQEEESFFGALRQVGKNFEKITRRVQSKNKDQVRHYYYRLVRRMNKLLGPGLCLDAKNSKDTNAAMLRWWSLLEKYSCKASKLHLKPRRFKIFVEALENQLLKDRKKNVRKRPSHGENGSPVAPSIVANQNRASGQDTRTVKLVLLDSQNMPKLGSGKLGRNINIGFFRSNNKGDPTSLKTARKRRKQESITSSFLIHSISSAAYKKWEKAAIAGVSLVAEAAEHLERTVIDKEAECDQGQSSLEPVEKALPPLPSQNNHVDSNVHNNMKLKLQLFPIDDATRRALEMDKHNPHLELTLSMRKKISSILEHLNRKWGNSSVASGELMLFPYNVHRENLVSCQKWTPESVFSAADVYAFIGRPPVFRLRYGWFPIEELTSPDGKNLPFPGMDTMDMEHGKRKSLAHVSTCGSSNDQSHKFMDSCDNQINVMNENHACDPSSDVPDEVFVCFYAIERYNCDDLPLCNGTAGEWADSLTNISVGDLLAEVPHDENLQCTESPMTQSNQCLQQIPFSCDSFDAAIAAHMSKHQNKSVFCSTAVSHTSSIWDAEETCDAFSFQKNNTLYQEVPTTSCIASYGTDKQMTQMCSAPSGTLLEELANAKGFVENASDEDPINECQFDVQDVENSGMDLTGLADIYWPDSLGPIDLDMTSSKYHSEDVILSDSLSGLNRLIASSLDAFQNCSFFGLDKKDPSSKVEGREAVSFSDFKVGSGV